MRPTSGFTLLEVLLACLLLSVGLLGFAGTLGPASALAGAGKTRNRAALVVAARISRFRVELAAGAPGCVPPAGGAAPHGPGFEEAWTSVVTDRVVELQVLVRRPDRRGPVTDTVVTRMPCP